MIKNNTILLLLMSTLLFTACKKDNIKSAGPQFDIDLFEQNLINGATRGGNKPIAWGYTITQNGQLKRSDAFGDARLPQDGKTSFTLNKEINIASVTKLYTAMAAIKLIYANGLTIDSTIGKWLPASWTKGSGVNDVKFKELLMHTSGMTSINSSFDSTLSYTGLRSFVQAGVVSSKSRNYLNANFALFRVLIPSLWSKLPGAPAINIESDANTQFMYLLYMQQNIFDKAGLTTVGCMPESRSTCTLYYNVNDSISGNTGSYYGDWNPICGGGGYFMTLTEMAAVNAYFEHTETILNKTLKQVMKDNRIGYDLAPPASLERHGKYYGKNGSIGNTANQGVVAQVAYFPINGVEVAITMNTQGVTFNDPTGNNFIGNMIYNAYNNAWE